jgi:hypothetical protein
VGDWSSSGHTGIGTFDPATGTWYLRNTASPGAPDIAPFAFGAGSFIPVAGDWAGIGHSGIGAFDPASATWYLRNNPSAGAPDYVPFQFGLAGWIPVAADWTGSGHAGIGMFDPSTATWYFRNNPSPGAPDFVFQFGPTGESPVAGSTIPAVSTVVPEPALGLLAGTALLLLPWHLRQRRRSQTP